MISYFITDYLKRNNKQRQYIQFFYQGMLILEQKVPFDGSKGYGRGAKPILPLYYEKGRIYQERYKRSGEPKIVSFPINQKAKKLMGNDRIGITYNQELLMKNQGLKKYEIQFTADIKPPQSTTDLKPETKTDNVWRNRYYKEFECYERSVRDVKLLEGKWYRNIRDIKVVEVPFNL